MRKLELKTIIKAATASAIALPLLILAGCATSEGTEKTFDVAQRNYSNPPSSPSNEKGIMRHSLRQISEYDSYKMTNLVNREINLKDDNDENYLNQVAITLGQTVFLQPHFTERETALKELKSKIDQEDYVVVLQKAADDLLSIMSSESAASDQAGALVALTNLVTEVRTLRRPELKGILQKIADAKLTISPQAKKYAQDSMERLISPSQEAQSALMNL